MHRLEDLASELGVPVEDLAAVADVELGGPPHWDPDTETVSDEGRALLVEHFGGGTDPIRLDDVAGELGVSAADLAAVARELPRGHYDPAAGLLTGHGRRLLLRRYSADAGQT